jgi:FKBP-type peptidyl-prolyl cis-trans isomerase SlyD
MKKGDIIKVSFTGKEKESGKVVDTTDEKTAKEAGFPMENRQFKPVVVIVGNGELVKGLDECLMELNVGENKKLEVSPEKGFGERDPKKVSLMALQEFKRRKLTPVPGMVIEADGRYGKVQSVSGGRVRVDFNHELAGKTLDYDVKVEEEFTEASAQVNALLEKFFAQAKEMPKIKLEEDVLEVTIKTNDQLTTALKPLYAKNVIEFVEAVKKVRFVEEFDAASFSGKRF